MSQGKLVDSSIHISIIDIIMNATNSTVLRKMTSYPYLWVGVICKIMIFKIWPCCPFFTLWKSAFFSKIKICSLYKFEFSAFSRKDNMAGFKKKGSEYVILTGFSRKFKMFRFRRILESNWKLTIKKNIF